MNILILFLENVEKRTKSCAKEIKQELNMNMGCRGKIFWHLETVEVEKGLRATEKWYKKYFKLLKKL